jgi:N-carbamoylputrescine amidase
MRLGLSAYKFINNDMQFNINQIEKAIKQSENIDMLCFGETFLQGFDAFNWNYEHDKDIAINKDSNIMKKLEQLSLDNNVDLAFGYLEKEDDILYSSYAIIINGKLTYNYRRISLGWKEVSLTDYHYKEGNEVVNFNYKGHNIVLALCGDLWEYPEKFKSNDLLLWPVYVNFSLDEWKEYEQEYADQALIACNNTLMINSLSDDSRSYGGAFYFKDGKVHNKTTYDKEDILIIEI